MREPQPIATEPRRFDRAWTKYIRLKPRSIAAIASTRRHKLFGSAWAWLLPWGVQDYPGIKRGLGELMQGRVSWSSIRDWRTGRRSLPSWAALILADAIEGRALRGLELVAELRAYHAQRVVTEAGRRHVGFCSIDPVTGRDGRHRGGRRRKAKQSDLPSIP